ETKLVPVAVGAFEKRLAVGLVLLGGIEPAWFAVAGHAIALDIAQMRAGGTEAVCLVELRDPIFDHDAALTIARQSITTGKLPPGHAAAPDPAAGKGAAHAPVAAG